MSNVIEFPLNRHQHKGEDFLWQGLKAIAAPSKRGERFTLTVSIHPEKGPTFAVVYPEGRMSREEVAAYLRAAAKALEMPRVKL